MQPGDLVAVGRTSDVYEFGSDDVIKVSRPHVPDEWARLEADFTVAIGALDIPAPKVVDVVDVDGRTAIVFRRVHGQTMWQRMLDEPSRIDDLVALLAETHRRILAAGPPDGVEGLVDRVGRKIEAVEQVTSDERREALATLRELPKGAALLHGDLHPGNVLMSDDGPVVIDWFDASIGHPIADVVRSSLLMRPLGDRGDSPHLPDGDVDTLLRVHDAYVGAMSDVVDAPAHQLRRWEAVIAISRLAEGDLPDGPALLELWHRRDEPVGPLFDALRTRSRAS